MGKYKKGDKVVIRKDLEIYKWYGNFTWSEDKEYMKEKDYVVIDEVNTDGDYLVENIWAITDEMIEGLYQGDLYKELLSKLQKMMQTLGKTDSEIANSLEEINTEFDNKNENVKLNKEIKGNNIENMKIIGIAKKEVNGELRNAIYEFEGVDCKFKVEKTFPYEFTCELKPQSNGTVWEASILDGNDSFEGNSEDLYNHIRKSIFQYEEKKEVEVDNNVEIEFKPAVVEALKSKEIIKEVLLKDGTVLKCNASDLIVLKNMDALFNKVSANPTKVIVLSSEIVAIK